MIPFDQALVDGDRLLSPFMQTLDVRLKNWREGYIALSADLKPEFTNIHGSAHGGFVLSLLDTALAFSGIWSAPNTPQKRAVTLALNTQFLAPLITPSCTAIGELERSGRSIFFSKASVYDAEQQLIATAQANFKLITTQ